MKKLRLISAGMTFILVSAFNIHAQETADSASDWAVELQAIEQTTPIPASQLPDSGTFYSAQHSPVSPEPWPPLPIGFLNAPAWPLGSGVFILDDLGINYSAVSQATAGNQKAGGMMPMDDPSQLINTNFTIAQQATNIVLNWQSASNRIYMVEQRPTLTSDSYWTQLTNYVLSASSTNITSLVLANLIQQQPIDFFRLFDVTPIANNDFFAIDQDSSANQLDIFDNDIDPNGDPIFISNIVPASHGDISYSLDATTFQYTPAAGFYGIDTFQYSITSGYGDVSSNATVTVFVNKSGNSPPTMPDISITLPTNTYTATFNALTNATDPDGDTVSLYAVTSPNMGSVSNDASGNIYYTRNPNLFGQDSFTYIVTDGNGGYGVGNVTILQQDTSGDGLSDQWDLRYGFDPTIDNSMADPDGDGLPNLAEFVLGTNPNVADNPLNLSAVTNGAQFSGFIQIPILGLSPTLAQTPPIFLYVNGSPAENSFVSQGADGQWLINWDTTYLTNGSYEIQASVQYNQMAGIGQTNEAFGVQKTVQVNNPITFDKLTTIFGNDLYITGTLADTNDTYDVYLYDPDGNLLVYATNVFAPNGQIGLEWDLTDGNGNQISFGNILAEFYLHPQNDPNGIQPLDDPNTPPFPHWFLKEGIGSGEKVFSIAWGWDSYGSQFDNNESQLVQGGAVDILGNPADNNAYLLLPGSNIPLSDSTFRFDSPTDKTVLTQALKSSGNFFWFGHSGGSVIMGQETHSYLDSFDTQKLLGNYAALSSPKTPLQNKHPYYFTVLLGCETYQPTWANAFGVTFSANGTTDSSASYENVGRQPNAFVGWTKLVFLPSANDFSGLEHSEYENVVATLFGDWMAGYPLNSCMDDFNATASSYGFTGSNGADSWQISGCYDLQKPF
jgi:Bacterial Ig domain